MKRLQAGFTLIELVIVIVILGILAATALPRFVDLSGDARTAAFQGVRGAFASAINLAHATWLARGGDDATITLEGAVTVNMSAGGYPTIDNANATQNTAAELYALLMQNPLPTDWTSSETAAAGAGTGDYTLAGDGGDTFTYDATDGSVTP